MAWHRLWCVEGYPRALKSQSGNADKTCPLVWFLLSQSMSALLWVFVWTRATLNWLCSSLWHLLHLRADNTALLKHPEDKWDMIRWTLWESRGGISGLTARSGCKTESLKVIEAVNILLPDGHSETRSLGWQITSWRVLHVRCLICSVNKIRLGATFKYLQSSPVLGSDKSAYSNTCVNSRESQLGSDGSSFAYFLITMSEFTVYIKR